MTRFQKVAAAATIALIVLIFVGAIVRASGSGLGCPDWPTCWGCLIPPTSVEDVDFENLDLQRFQRTRFESGHARAVIEIRLKDVADKDLATLGGGVR